jgi:hypothetical protein
MDIHRNRLAVRNADWKPAGTGIILPNNKFPIDEDKIGPDIDTNTLVDTHTRRRNQRAKIYEQMYRKCCQRIRYSNDVLYTKECVFKVPEVQLWGGLPRYQLNGVLAYIMLRLKQKDIDVRFLPPDSLLINWRRAVSGDAAMKRDDDNIVRYELDEINTQVPKQLDHIASNHERLIHNPCKGDCCTGPDANRPRRVNKKELRELERRKQQMEIDRLIKQKEGIRR